jgi:MYXO-CTERM domain-containing protein
MKTSNVILSGVGSLILASAASAGYAGLSAETSSQSGTNLLGQSWSLDVVRIFVDLENAGDRLDAVYGSEANGLVIGTTAEFYQNAAGGDSSLQINAALFGVYNSVEYDTFVTIGNYNSTGDALLVQAVDFSNFSTEVTTDNGTWVVTPDDIQGEGSGGRVLIGQFSFAAGTGGVDSMYGSVNLQGSSADGSTWDATGQWLPAPGAFALLGLAGLAGRRRRRN